MNELIKVFPHNGQVITTSRDVAKAFQKEHFNVIRNVERMILENSKVSSLMLSSSYQVTGQERRYPEYLLTRDGFALLAMSFTGAKALEFKLRYINAFNSMEDKLHNRKLKALEKTTRSLMCTYKTYTATELAKELGFRNVQTFNTFLEKHRIQYKCNGTWVLYAKYAAYGYVSTKSEVLKSGYVSYITRWTQKGRAFILDRFQH